MPRVLLVGDDPDILRTVTFRLKEHGHRVSAASCGLEALRDGVARRMPDLLVAAALPDMTRAELLGHLRGFEGHEHLPALFLGGGEDAATTLSLPFTTADLVDAVAAALTATHARA
jgi:CheY-like chemotaxis protein